MPLTPIAVPADLITLHDGGAGAVLNRARHPELKAVKGEPTYSQRTPQDAAREAFAALKVASKRNASGDRQQIFLGDSTVELLYGRQKKKDEQDCENSAVDKEIGQ